ncbi:MAG: GNAT family N-acetyltransferase [Alphaproteobacteria bacterium]
METIEAGIRSKRLTLRPVERRDAARIIEALGDYDLARNLATVPHPYPAKSFEDFLARHEARGSSSRPFVILERDVVGMIGLSDILRDETNAVATIGYWVAKPFWGRGFATEAGGALVEHAFSTLGFTALKSGHFKDNPASGRVLAKLGFRYTGESKRHSLARGEEVAHIDVLLTRGDWEARKLIFAAK